MGTSAVDIVLPCYNAGVWIDGFVNGLLRLDMPSWRLIARDDGSSDDTLSVLQRWRTELGDRMLLVDSSAGNLGVIGNYNAVLASTSADWVLSADPDDVWLPNHVALVLEALRHEHTPVAVATDAVVVNEDLSFVAPSFWRWSHNVPHARARLPRMSMESPALGSTMAVNRALLDMALPIAPDAAYQDWWLVLVATAFGKLITLSDATILYRRHEQSITRNPFAFSLTRALGRVSHARKRVDFLIRQAGKQAAAFADRYESHLDSKDVAALRALAALAGMNAAARRAAVIRHGLWFTWWLKNLGLLAFL